MAGAPAAASASERHCGGWIRARALPAGEPPEALAGATQAALKRAADAVVLEAAAHELLPASQLAAVQAQCLRDAAAGRGSLRAAAREAYLALRARIGAARSPAAAAGALAGAGCTAPAGVGVTLYTVGAQLRIVDDGLLTGGAREALLDMGESLNRAAQAQLAHDEMQRVTREGLVPRVHLTSLEVQQFLEGYFWHSAVPARSNPHPVSYLHVTGALLTYVVVETSANATQGFSALTRENAVENMRSYLYGLAAQCASALPAALPSASWPLRASPPGVRGRARGPLPPGLFRLPPSPPEASNAELLARAAAEGHRAGRLDRLAYELTSASSLDSVAADCAALALAAFPEETAALLFERVVGRALYRRLEGVVDNVRAAVLAALDGPVARAAFNATAEVRACAASSAARIVGAPRDSWAGRTAAAPRPRLRSRARVFELLFEQAQALLAERARSTLESGDVSEFWAEEEPVQRNACAAPAPARGPAPAAPRGRAPRPRRRRRQVHLPAGGGRRGHLLPGHGRVPVRGAAVRRQVAGGALRLRGRARDRALHAAAPARDVDRAADGGAAAPLQRGHAQGGAGRRAGRRRARGRGARALRGAARAPGAALLRAAAARLRRAGRADRDLRHGRAAPLRAAPRRRAGRHAGRLLRPSFRGRARITRAARGRSRPRAMKSASYARALPRAPAAPAAAIGDPCAPVQEPGNHPWLSYVHWMISYSAFSSRSDQLSGATFNAVAMTLGHVLLWLLSIVYVFTAYADVKGSEPAAMHNGTVVAGATPDRSNFEFMKLASALPTILGLVFVLLIQLAHMRAMMAKGEQKPTVCVPPAIFHTVPALLRASLFFDLVLISNNSDVINSGMEHFSFVALVVFKFALIQIFVANMRWLFGAS